jgi:hypothetical protein
MCGHSACTSAKIRLFKGVAGHSGKSSNPVGPTMKNVNLLAFFYGRMADSGLDREQ